MADKNKKNDNHDENNNGDNNDSGSNPTTKNGQQHEQKSSKRTYYHFIPNEIKYVIIAVAAVAIIWLGLRLVLQVENPFYIVSSESMVPTLMVGDVLVLRNGNGGFSFSDLQVGDIIVFHSEDGGGRTIVHRIVEIYQDNNSNKEGTEGRGGERLIKTKGDANPVSYAVLDYPIEEADYYGKVIFVIPKVGLVLKALGTSPINYIIILAAIVIVAISMILLHYYRNDRKKRMQI